MTNRLSNKKQKLARSSFAVRKRGFLDTAAPPRSASMLNSARFMSSQAPTSKPRLDVSPAVHALGIATIGTACWLFYGMMEEDKAKHRGVWDPDRQHSLDRAQASQDPDSIRPRVYMDLSIDGAPAGRLVIKLRDDLAPRTAEAFRGRCTGEGRLSFRGTTFERIVPGFIVQGGGKPATGYTSKEMQQLSRDYPLDESFVLPHSARGVVALATKGDEGELGPVDGSMPFYVLMAESAPHLNGKHVVFGECEQGMKVLTKLEKLAAQHATAQNAPAANGDPNQSKSPRSSLPNISVEGCGEIRRRRQIAPRAVSAMREMQSESDRTKGKGKTGGGAEGVGESKSSRSPGGK